MKRIFSLAAVIAIAITASAQQAQPVPVDPAVRIGHLDNGLTYYIRHNEEPRGQANFYIAQKVGSILEDEEQRGLAHFLEHMCFNGTEHFPGNGIIKYCEKIGVKFGNNLNAYTSIDETVYNIDNVPIANVPDAVDSCLWILHDWADGLLLTADDIDHERGVIHEEWRSRMNNATLRLYEKILPEVYPGNKYGQRMPIGLMSVVDNFPYQVLRDYYEKWYRPDQQGIIVVGDVDVDAIEAKIKDIFGTIAKPVDPAERYYVQIEDNAEPIISIAADKEQPVAMTYIFCKHDAYPNELKGDINYLVYSYALYAASIMMQDRIQEMLQSAEPPFINASISDDDFFLSKTKRAWSGVAVTSEAGLTKGVTAVYREMLRAVRNGFTESEYERARAEILSRYETAYNQREKRKSAEYCSEYVRHFVDNEPIPGIENEFVLSQQLAPAIPVAVINQVVASFIGQGNLVVACMLPEKEGIVYPTADELKASLESVAAEDIAPYVDAVSDEPLISNPPVAGKVIGSSDYKFGYRKYVLSNGATVYIRKTDFNKDKILMKAQSIGGTCQYPDSDIPTLKSVEELMTIGGVGNFSRTALSKALSGKVVSVDPFIGSYLDGTKASSSPREFETMLQLNYLYFTSLRQDDEAFASWKNRSAAAIANREKQPMAAFQDTLSTTIYDHPARVMATSLEDLESVDYSRALTIARERFANASDFVFVFTGNIDEDTALPLIEKYIGSLPSAGKKEKASIKYDFVRGIVSNQFDKPMEIPMVTSCFLYQGKAVTGLKESLSFDIALNALSVVLLEEIREKEGGTYGIGAYGELASFPKKEGYFQIAYQTDPERYEYLNRRVLEIVNDFAANGPRKEDMNKAKEYFVKNYKENQRENSYWADTLTEYLLTGIDKDTDYIKVIKSISTQDVRKAFVAIVKQNNHAEIIMKGTAAGKAQ